MSDPMASASSIQSAVDAAVDTANSTIDWDGIKVTVPAELEDVDPDAIEAFEQGRAITAMRAIFGSDEYDRIRKEWAKAHDGQRPKMREIGKLSDLIAEHFGFENAGE